MKAQKNFFLIFKVWGGGIEIRKESVFLTMIDSNLILFFH